MERWYLGFGCYDRPDVLIQQVSRRVRENRLGRLVPVARLEKKLAARGKVQFYLFLGIESTRAGEVPPQVRAGLLDVPGLLPQPLRDHFRLDQIKPMCSAEIQVEVYARRIPYYSPPAEPNADPFFCLNDEGGLAAADDGRAFDRLLWWLSARGAGTWATFCGACAELGLDRNGARAGHILRRLRLLAHLETSADRGRWTVAPTALVGCGRDGPEEYVLCGARDAGLLAALAQIGRVEEGPQPASAGPTAYRLVGSIRGEVQKCLEREGLVERVHLCSAGAEFLASELPTQTEWKRGLEQVGSVQPYRYEVRRFQRSAFVPVPFESRSGFYQFWQNTENGQTGSRPECQLYFDGTTGRWLRADWYGLRFLAQQEEGEACPCQFDNRGKRVAIPENWRWPEVYERALVLASGSLPHHGNGWLVYEGISPQLMERFKKKLSLKIESAGSLLETSDA